MKCNGHRVMKSPKFYIITLIIFHFIKNDTISPKYLQKEEDDYPIDRTH